MGDFIRLQAICMTIARKPKESLLHLRELHNIIKGIEIHLLQRFREYIFGTLYHFIQNHDDYQNEYKVEIVNILSELFKRLKTDNVGFYFNNIAFLVNEIYDTNQKNFVRDIYEEYKLLIINCVLDLNHSVSIDMILEMYNKERTPKYSPIVYVCISLARDEKLRSLRIAAIECIMSLARVDTDEHSSDIILQNQIADIFMFFLPGISIAFSKIALEDEKVGHKIIKTAVRGWGRITNLLMTNYNPKNSEITMEDINLLLTKSEIENTSKCTNEWKNKEEIRAYINKSVRDLEWYKETDKNLYKMIDLMANLCNHSHWAVKAELGDISLLLLQNCASTMPKCLSKIVEILITLSEDTDSNVSSKCRSGLDDLSTKFSENSFNNLLNNLQEDFLQVLNQFPRIFNGIDEYKKESQLNLLIGYMKLFGKYEFMSILHSPTYLQRLIESLLFICELEKTNVQLLEEWTVQDFDTNPDLRSPWKRFEHFGNGNLSLKLAKLCQLLAQDILVDIVTDCLLDIYLDDLERRKEATILLNEIFSAKTGNQNTESIKSLINMYLEPKHWNIPTSISSDTNDKVTLGQVQNNTIQICLQLEGIGKLALLLQENFQDFLLKTLYPVIEKAGSAQPFVKAAGLTTITNIAVACKYTSVTDLINKNSDYFSYHVTRKLKQLEKNQHVLNVLGVVMNHCSMNVLPSIADIVEDVLHQSRDLSNKNVTSFLIVFNIFIKCLIRWLDVTIELKPIISKAEKARRLQEELYKSQTENVDFSDDVMGKTAEEMYEEDMKKTKEELEDDELNPEVEEVKAPEPPSHIKLTVAILRRTLNFLPSKDKDAKILCLEILKNGLEIIRDWENELLPIVHQIWSPLIDRFKTDDDPLIFNLSFQLLIPLARLSRDFIRSRTVKDLLPSILSILEKLSKNSYLKDRGSSYRYTQTYKLQLVLLQNFARIVVDLEMGDEQMVSCMEVVKLYLNNKQPLPLRNHSVEFFQTLALCDPEIVKNTLNTYEKSPEIEMNLQYLLDYIK